MGALTGIKIVNTGFNLPGPLAAYHLAQLGAEIIKIEPPDGDPMIKGSAAFYKALNKNQKIEKLDLKEKGDREILDSHLETCDLLMTSLRPESLKRLSLDWSHLHKKFPKLCVLSIYGFPSPHEGRAGHDITYQAFAGLLRPPHLPTTCFADFSVGQEAALKGLALLFEKQRTGKAHRAEVSLVDSLSLHKLPLEYGLTTSRGILGGILPEYNIYKAKEGWVAVAVLENQFKSRFQNLLKFAEWNIEAVKNAMLLKTAGEWEEWAMKNDLPIAALREKFDED